MKKNIMSKTHYAYNFMRTGILNGTFGPGQRIVIDQIAKELGLSIIPVREAIRQLESEGLIQYKPYSGAIVSTINETEYVDTLSVLAILEGYATALSAAHITPDEISELERLNEQMKEALLAFEFEAFGELNREFHCVIYRKCDNQYLKEEIKKVMGKMDTLRRSAFTFVPQRAHNSVEEHARIIQMLKEGALFEDIEKMARQHKLNTASALRNRKASLFATKKNPF
ncbi:MULTISPECIES: GntR family transcriptional regulator [Aneurinibacillus]|nr:GntR family transcriptional regulator [Aneurinibacillus sp. XH2]AMA74768.1 GntR family transcriptional regulator [Aneurinibacillus sp. XH2]QYY43564.1 GntR family transcriptional regulator [Aneurinibacillus thermoaerophilus]